MKDKKNFAQSKIKATGYVKKPFKYVVRVLNLLF